MVKGRAGAGRKGPGEKGLKELYEAVLKLRTLSECAGFFSDLCTPAELVSMADRWKVARMLDQGIPYREIYQRSGVSTATVTRVARALVYGESGYRKALAKLRRKPLAALLLAAALAPTLGWSTVVRSAPAAEAVPGAAAAPLSLSYPDLARSDFLGELGPRLESLNAAPDLPAALAGPLAQALAEPAPALGRDLARRVLLDSLKDPVGVLPDMAELLEKAREPQAAADLRALGRRLEALPSGSGPSLVGLVDSLRRSGVADLAGLGLPGKSAPAGWSRLFDSRPRADPGQEEDFELLPVGVETEYSPMKGGKIDLDGPAREEYAAMLEGVRSALGGPSSEIRSLRFLKHDSGLTQAYFLDSQGGAWKATPELLNNFALLEALDPGEVPRRFDGLELVAPPLRPEGKQGELLLRAHEAMGAGGRYGRGLLSATQFTFGVSHLIDPDGNVSRLVDRILFFESRIREIYALVNPTRTGTLVNLYSVPLSANQKGLLRELAALPPAFRSKGRVRALFEKYEERELSLAGADANAAWKYRALNYKKALGLLGTEEKPVLELRIADFADARDLIAIPRMLSAIFGAKPPIGIGAGFEDPFPGLSDNPSLFELNEAILALPEGRYRAFLGELRLPAEDYPPFPRLAPPIAGSPGPALPSAALAARFPAAALRLRLLERAAQEVAPEILSALRLPPEELLTPERAISLIVETALSGASLLARRFGALALFDLNDGRFAPLLAQALKDPDLGVRTTAASAIRLLREPDYGLLEAALRDPQLRPSLAGFLSRLSSAAAGRLRALFP